MYTGRLLIRRLNNPPALSAGLSVLASNAFTAKRLLVAIKFCP
jgi:hypothetical protein